MPGRLDEDNKVGSFIDLAGYAASSSYSNSSIDSSAISLRFWTGYLTVNFYSENLDFLNLRTLGFFGHKRRSNLTPFFTQRIYAALRTLRMVPVLTSTSDAIARRDLFSDRNSMFLVVIVPSVTLLMSKGLTFNLLTL